MLKTKLEIQYSTLAMGKVFKDSQRMSEMADNIKPYIDYVSSCTILTYSKVEFIN